VKHGYAVASPGMMAEGHPRGNLGIPGMPADGEEFYRLHGRLLSLQIIATQAHMYAPLKLFGS
jgi:hypothetical protein